MLKTTKCKYFNGLINKKCEFGIEYKDVAVESGIPNMPPIYQHVYPCVAFGLPVEPEVMAQVEQKCAPCVYPSKEEEEADRKRVEERIAEWSHKIASNVCPTHNIPITKKQVGRCIYAEPCGCRLGQGKLKKSRKDEEAI